MKYIDTYFKFPIRIYDETDIRGISTAPGEPIKARLGVRRLRHTEILGWQDMKFREIKQYNHEGEELLEEFPCTLIETREKDHLCHWNRKRFEKELQAHVEELQKFDEEERGKELQEIIALEKRLNSKEVRGEEAEDIIEGEGLE